MMHTHRLHLPLLATAQAQKEMTHNEALALLDIAVQAVVVEVAPSAIPVSPLPGQSWIVSTDATGAWGGQDGAIATWTTAGWRFVMPFEGMMVWSLADGVAARRIAGGWDVGGSPVTAVLIQGNQVVGPRRPPIADPSGGMTVDAEVRTAVSSLLDALRTHGLIEI